MIASHFTLSTSKNKSPTLPAFYLSVKENFAEITDNPQKNLHMSEKNTTFAPEIDLFPLLHEKVSEKFRNRRYLITIIYAP